MTSDERAYPLLKSWLLWAVVALLYFWWPMHLDYYPDEGYFAEMTARLLRGELPNIDFANNYLGGLYLYNAVWFGLLGKSLWTMRMGMLFLLCAVFVPVTYQLARFVMGRFWASTTTLLMMAMTISINPTVSGNWYALTFVLLAVWVFFNTHTKHPRFWVLTGFLLGIAFLMKHTVAMYGAFALFVMWLLALCVFRSRQREGGFFKHFGTFAVVAGLLKAMLFPVYILLPHWSFHGFLIYVVPPVLVCGFLAKRIWRIRNRFPFAHLARTWLWWTLGFMTPVCLFLLPYVMRGGESVLKLLQEVFVQFPALYLKIAFIDFIPQLSIIDTLVVIWILLLAVLLYRRKYVPFCAMLLMGLWAIVAFVWQPFQAIINRTILTYMQFPLIAIGLGAWFYVRWIRRDRIGPSQFFIASFWVLAVFLYFNTYPLGAIFYSIYAMVPTVFLIGYMGSRLSPSYVFNKRLRVFCMVLVAYALGYGMLFAHRQIDFIGRPDAPLFPNRVLTYKLPQPHGGTYVQPEFGKKITTIVNFILKNSSRPDDVFVFSDLPVLYFLSDHKNPTRYSYEMDSYHSDGGDIIADLEQHNVTWVIVDPSQKNYQQPKLNSYMASRYTPYAQLAQDVQVFIRKAD